MNGFTEFLVSIARDLPMAALLGWFLLNQMREAKRSRIVLEGLVTNHLQHNTEALEGLTVAITELRQHCLLTREHKD